VILPGVPKSDPYSVSSRADPGFAKEETKWRHGVVVSSVGLINEVNQHQAQLVLGWVTVCGRVNHLGM